MELLVMPLADVAVGVTVIEFAPEVMLNGGALIEKGWHPFEDLHYHEIEGADHSEGAWAARVDPINALRQE